MDDLLEEKPAGYRRFNRNGTSTVRLSVLLCGGFYD